MSDKNLNDEVINHLLNFYVANKDMLLQKYESIIKIASDDISVIRMLVHTYHLMDTKGTATTIPQEYIDMYEYIDRNDEWLDGAFYRRKKADPEETKNWDKIMFSMITFYASYKELQKQKQIMKPNSLIYQRITKIHDFVTDDGIHIDQADIYVNEKTIGSIIDFKETYPTAEIGDTVVLEVYYPEPHDYEAPFTRTRFVELIKNQNN
jgi:hypothetical protein